MKWTLFLLTAIVAMVLNSCATYENVAKNKERLKQQTPKYKPETTVYSKTQKRVFCIDSVHRANEYGQVYYYVSDPVNGAKFESVLENSLTLVIPKNYIP